MNAERTSVLVATATETTPVDSEAIEGILNGEGTLRIIPWLNRHAATVEMMQIMEMARGLLVRTGTVDAELMDRCPHLQAIALHGAGVDQVDVQAAAERGITVTNVPGGNAQAVAEMTLGLALTLMRGIVPAHLAMSKGDWEGGLHTGREIRGMRWGILGMGLIGKLVAGLAHAMGAEVAFYHPRPRPELTEGLPGDVRAVSWENLLQRSDVISVHVPLTDENTHLIDAAAIGQMKLGAYLINVARGPVVQAEAAARAAHRGELGGVALDVFDREPAPGEDIEPLLGDRVVLTPHLAGSTQECLREIAERATRDIVRIWRGEHPQHPVAGPNL